MKSVTVSISDIALVCIAVILVLVYIHGGW
jgi:hypothetical protein